MILRNVSLSVLVSLAMFAILQIMALRATGGVFEYPLDDVYIHLAIANSIARGEYGINPGEYASAASSIIYPVILAPFSGLGIERFMPLVVNMLALIGIAITWAKIVTRMVPNTALAVGLVGLGPLALNFAGVAMTGMEHALHVWASLVIVLGLLRLTAGERTTWGFFAAVILAPLIRFEGMALALVACTIYGIYGSKSRALLLAVAVIAPVAAFIAFLTAHDIGPLPTSVLAKQSLAGFGEFSLFDRMVITLIKALQYSTAYVALIASAVLLFISLVGFRTKRESVGWIALIGSGCGFAHLLFGGFGWAFRYEAYVMAVLAATWVAIWTTLMPDRPLRSLLVLSFFAVPLYTYQTKVPRFAPNSARAIHLQQEQMARFAQDFLKAPVAVNDIGRVAWRNPNYVLDLYGLASRQALALRQDETSSQGWAGPLAQAKGVEAALVYDFVFPHAFPATWTKVATLESEKDMGWIVMREVDIYATSPAYVDKVRSALLAMSGSLPEGAKLVFLP
ncbi:MAG: hypothetical protein ABI459_01545 [Deltaproteobacteria bacterium]